MLQLVERFLKSDGDDREDAFAALVQRHGPMVLGVCRRMLRGSADVDDAFQAVFLVLARKARRLSNVERLKPWLYGVAVRTAKEARRRSARRRQREGSAMDESKVASASNETRGELLDMLDEEIDPSAQTLSRSRLALRAGRGVAAELPRGNSVCQREPSPAAWPEVGRSSASV